MSLPVLPRSGHRAGRPARGARATTLVACLLPFACSGDSTGPSRQAPAAVESLVAVSASGTVGRPLGDSIAVRVTDRDGAPIAGVAVEWDVTSGELAAGRRRTNGDGVVRAAWTLGTTAGVHRATATVGRLAPVEFTATAQPDRPSAVRPARDSVILGALGDTATVVVQVVDRFGNAVAGSALSWTSSDPGVAEVSQAGLVTARNRGSATVTATADAATGPVPVVVRFTLSDVRLSEHAVTLTAIAETHQLRATAHDPNGAALPSAGLAWSSLDGGVAAVDASGLLRAVGPGTTRVVAASDGVADTATVVVSPVPVALSIAPPAAPIAALGATLQLAAAVRDRNGYPITGVGAVVWSAPDPAIATVDGAGLVTGRQNGQARIVAEAGGWADTATVVVQQRVATLSLDREQLELRRVGATATLVATGIDALGSFVVGAPVTWTTDAPNVVTVGGGVVTVKAAGVARVTAAADGKSVTATVTVPARYVVSAVGPDQAAAGSAFTVRVLVDGRLVNANAGALAVTLTWDPALARLDAATPHAPGGGALVAARADAAAGTYRLLLSDPSAASGAAPPFLLAELAFTAVGPAGSRAAVAAGVTGFVVAGTFADQLLATLVESALVDIR